jgi:hypothetical protein
MSDKDEIKQLITKLDSTISNSTIVLDELMDRMQDLGPIMKLMMLSIYGKPEIKARIDNFILPTIDLLEKEFVDGNINPNKEWWKNA